MPKFSVIPLGVFAARNSFVIGLTTCEVLNSLVFGQTARGSVQLQILGCADMGVSSCNLH